MTFIEKARKSCFLSLDGQWLRIQAVADIKDENNEYCVYCLNEDDGEELEVREEDGIIEFYELTKVE